MTNQAKTAKIQALLARLDELEGKQNQSETQAMVDEMLKEELDGFRAQLNSKHTTKAIEKLRADFATHKETNKLEPIYQAIAKADTSNQKRSDALTTEFSQRIQAVIKELSRNAKKDRQEDSRSLKMALGELSSYRTSIDPQMRDLASQDALLASEVDKLHQQLNQLVQEVSQEKDSTALQDTEVRMTALIEETNRTLTARIASIHHGGNMNRNIAVNGNTSVLSRYTDINWKAGPNVTLTAVKNDTTKYTDIIIATSGGGGVSGYQSPTGTVNGVNKVFVYSTAPNAVVTDGLTLQKVASDTTVNWTGTTTITLSVAPNFDHFGVA